MDRFRRILFLERHLEGSCRACTTAVRLARISGARLTVAVHVTRDFERWQARLDDIAASAADEGVEVEPRLLGGEARTAIANEVKRGGHDLFMAVAGSSSGPSLSPGHPLDRALLRTLPCATWLLAPAQSGPIRVVLAGVRLSNPEPEPLDRRLVEVSAWLAERTGARLVVANFWGLLGESVLASPTRGVRRGRLDRVLGGAGAEQERRMDALVGVAAPGVDAQTVVRKGDAARGMVEVARSIQADVIVAGNTGRSGFEGVLFGNLTERLLGRVHGSVLALRQEDAAQAVPAGTARGAARRTGVVASPPVGRVPRAAADSDDAGRA